MSHPRLIAEPPAIGRPRGTKAWRVPAISILLLLVVLLGNPARADGDDEDGPKRRYVAEFLPRGRLYPEYIADPLRPQNALTFQWLADTELVATGAGRFGLRLGGSLGIFRWQRPGATDYGWQLSFEGGFAGEFDLEHQWDNTGWDGFYGLYLSWMLNPDFGFRVGYQHNSSHVGDEYWNRTRVWPIHYTREEIVLGLSWRFAPYWRVYSEIGYGNGFTGEPPGRLESGLELVGDPHYWNNRAALYAAADVRVYQEVDWSTRYTIQGGYRIPVKNGYSAHRFALELGTGRSVMGQFYNKKETYLALGWYYDW